MLGKNKIKNKLENFQEKIKAFIHKYDWLDKTAFFLYGIFWIIRAEIVFKKLRKNIPESFSDKKQKKSKILVLAIRAIPSTNLVYFDAMFGHGFRRAGCEVLMLYCDGLMDSCDADTVFRNQKAQCLSCRKLGKTTKKCLGLEQLNCISYRDYISDADISDIKKEVAKLKTNQLLNHQYLGVDVGMHAKVATIRFFLYGRMDLTNPKEEAIFREK